MLRLRLELGLRVGVRGCVRMCVCRMGGAVCGLSKCSTSDILSGMENKEEDS